MTNSSPNESPPPYPPYEPERLARWLYDILHPDSRDPLPHAGRVSVAVQLQQLSFSDVQFARRLKDAVTIALVEWQPVHGIAYLASLARCAAYIRASSAVELLQNILASGRLDVFLADEERNRQHISMVIGTIGGFAPLPAVRSTMENLFVDRRFRHRYAPQIVTGLVRCDRENYPVYVEQFLRMTEDEEVLLDLVGITREIVRIVNPATIARQLPKMSDPWHYRFCELLGGFPNSPGRWGSRDAFFVLEIAPTRKYAPVEYAAVDNSQANDICVVIDERLRRDGGIEGIMRELAVVQ